MVRRDNDISGRESFETGNFDIGDDPHDEADNGAHCGIFHGVHCTTSVGRINNLTYIKKRTGVMYDARQSKRKFRWRLSPHIIVGTATLQSILSAILIEHTLKDRHIAGRHIHDLEANIE